MSLERYRRMIPAPLRPDLAWGYGRHPRDTTAAPPLAPLRLSCAEVATGGGRRRRRKRWRGRWRKRGRRRREEKEEEKEVEKEEKEDHWRSLEGDGAEGARGDERGGQEEG
eukprot:4773965-Pyramimonas_sp.AAC.1